jgi:hypothetical protein
VPQLMQTHAPLAMSAYHHLHREHMPQKHGPSMPPCVLCIAPSPRYDSGRCRRLSGELCKQRQLMRSGQDIQIGKSAMWASMDRGGMGERATACKRGAPARDGACCA